ncbi:MFS transporter [Saccharopolyspora cebuensis]|uniref:MFS transporter n=1 Tax=Saccharopolyspora cebuensis TaxID=418759 RepID=A0ABV4CHB6_9PSEU
MTSRAAERVGPTPAKRRWTALVFLSLLQFLIAIDVTVVNIALPSIGQDFQASPHALTWVVTGYTVVGGGLLLLGGRISDLLGRRRMFVAGAAVFGVASLVAGLAPGLPVLVLARFAQGIGEALASPAAMSLIALMFTDPTERAKALGVWGAVSSSGLVFGVLLSGVITDLASWRWVFLVNPPLVVAVLAVVPALVARDPARRPERLDLPGAALLTAAPLLLVLGIVQAEGHGWTSWPVLAPLAAGTACGIAFVRHERRAENPLVRLRILAHRTRLTANGATVLLSAALSTTFFLTTFYLQEVLDFGPLAAGVAFLPFCAALLLAVSVVGRVVNALGSRWTAVAGLLATALGTAWLSRLPERGDYAVDLLPGLLAVAVGMGIGLIALQNAALTDVTEDDAGVASGMQRSVDQLGGALGLSVLVGVAASSSAGATFGAEGYRWAFTAALVGLGLATAAVIAFASRRPER